MFQVFDNNKPADSTGYPALKGHHGWKKSKFNTLNEARVYARKWLKCGGDQACACDGIVLEIGRPHDYSGYGDLIEIREIK